MATKAEIISSVLVLTGHRPQMNANSPTYGVIANLVDSNVERLSGRSYVNNTAFNVSFKSDIVSPGDKWDSGISMRGVIDIQEPRHSYITIRHVPVGADETITPVLYDNSSLTYPKEATIWKVIYRINELDLTPTMLQFVISKSAYDYLAPQDGDQVALRKVEKDMQIAERELRVHQLNTQSVNVYRAPSFVGSYGKVVRGFRR